MPTFGMTYRWNLSRSVHWGVPPDLLYPSAIAPFSAVQCEVLVFGYCPLALALAQGVALHFTGFFLINLNLTEFAYADAAGFA